jgi:hypothetical protein
MSGFKKGYNAGSNSNRTFEDKILLFNNGVRHKQLTNFLSDGKQTKFRILPSISDGEEDVALNPEATQDTSMFDLFGQVAAVIEMTSGIGTGRYTYISGGFVDEAGNKVTDNWSVTKVLMHRLKYKLFETVECEKKKRHDLVDIPPSWKRWTAENFRKYRLSQPQAYVCFQCVASEINGNTVEDARGNPTWGGPYVMPIRRSAMDQFLIDLKTRTDPEADLDLDNNLFGDFCSLEGGHTILMRKIKAEDPDDKSSNASYNLKPFGKPTPLTKEYVDSMFTPWGEILYVPTIEKAIELFAQTFDGIAVDFALRDSDSYSEYIPKDYRGSSEGIAKTMTKAEREEALGAPPKSSSGGGGPMLPPANEDTPSLPAMPPVDDEPPAEPPKAFAGSHTVGGTDVELESEEDEAAFAAALADARSGGNG